MVFHSEYLFLARSHIHSSRDISRLAISSYPLFNVLYDTVSDYLLPSEFSIMLPGFVTSLCTRNSISKYFIYGISV